jgi:hypothetical protein
MSRLQEIGTASFSSLVNAVAADLYTDELRNGAGVLDIGLLGSRLFAGDVVQELKARDGILWEIKAAPDAAQASWAPQRVPRRRHPDGPL